MTNFIPVNKIDKVINWWKCENFKIIFTNGCFDIIHVGHIKLLEESKKLGDKLIVAINSDKSIKSLKENRPIMSENHRAKILSSIEFVDLVTIFSDITPYNIISKISPDIITKGSEYNKEDIIGSDIVDEVVTINQFHNLSSTKIIEKILTLEKYLGYGVKRS